MKHLDKIFTFIAILALVFFAWWLTNNFDNHTTVEERVIIDSTKIISEKLEQVTKKLNEATKEQTVLDSLAMVALMYPHDMQRAANRRSIIDSIRARRIRDSVRR